MSNRHQPKGMLLTTFLAKRYDWAQEPHLYCVLQKGQTSKWPAYRCGAAGTQLYKESDLPYGSGSSEKGLQGRMRQYQNYWLPQEARLFACLRTKKALVALPHQRTAGDAGAEYNVDRGNQTEVLAREGHYHHFLDQAGLRWQKDRNNELFQPTRGPIQIVESLRRVHGLQLLLFDEDDWREDALYKGGDTEPTIVRETKQRQLPTRGDKDQSLVIKMSKSGVEQLRAGNPTAYKRLMNLMREAFREENPKAASEATSDPPVPKDIVVPPGIVTGLRARAQATRARAAFDLAEVVLPRTRAQAAAQQPIANRTRARRPGA